jgi:DnaK suppressor protein
MTAQSPAKYRASSGEEYMNPRQVAYFRQRLLVMRASLTDELSAKPVAGIQDSDGLGDQTDQASAESDRDIEWLNHERMKLLLSKVDQALARMETGQYGFCEITGEPIGLERLEAQPTATLSLAAQQQQERQARGL